MAKRLIPTATAVASLALIAACGGGGPAPLATPTDTQAPQVLALSAQVADGTVVQLIVAGKVIMGVTGVSKNAFLVAQVNELTLGCPTASPVAGNFGGVQALYTCVPSATGSLWTMVPTAPLADGAMISVTLTPTDAAGNQSSVFVQFQVASAVIPPAKLEYADVVVGIWPLAPVGFVGLDRTVSGGYLPIKNSTGKQLYFTGLRATPRADCLVEASSLEYGTGVDIRSLYNPKTGEFTPDPSPNLALDRHKDFVYGSPWDPSHNPLWSFFVRPADGWVYVLDDDHASVYFQDNAGHVTPIVQSTFLATGGWNALLLYSCKAK